MAAELFEKLLGVTTDRQLRQKVLYKLGRAYEHLSRDGAWFGERIGGEDRSSFARKSVESYLAAVSSDPSGPLADDALAEAGVQSWLLLGDVEVGRQLLKRVLTEYPKENASDNALFWLAQLAMSDGKRVEALAYWARLSKEATSKRLREIAGENAKK
jgi:TolA-binding protein